MTELLTAAQMRAIEAAAIASGEVTGLELMERAGRGVVEAVFEEWPDLAQAPHRAVVLCGPGNNGGDGFVVARRLRDKGWSVEVFLLGDAAKLPPDAKTNHDIWCGMGEAQPLTPEAAGEGDRPELLVDALFGTGLSRAIPEAAALALRAARKRPRERDGLGERCRTVAVDCPSGLDADTGEILLPDPPKMPDDENAAFAAHTAWWEQAQRWINLANLTVTFHAAKVGHYLGSPPMPSGKLAVVDIGLGDWDRNETMALRPSDPQRVRHVGPWQHGHEMRGRMWPGEQLGALAPGQHKYDRGHALVLAGGPGRGGAGRLAARAALRIGAGLVTLGCPPAALQENAARLDAVMLRPVAGAAALAEMLRDDRIGAVCLGPGLGLGARTRDLVAAACADTRDGDLPPGTGGDDFRRRVVLDADALTSFENDPQALFALLHRNCVLTPHEGEFARLFPDLGQRRRGQPAGNRTSKLDAARAAADLAGCTILLKGPSTAIASPGGAASIHAALYDREAPWLGTAGAGDVLAGMIVGLLASGHAWNSPHPKVEAAAWLHAECALKFGPGLIAEDLPEQLPKVFRDLGI